MNDMAGTSTGDRSADDRERLRELLPAYSLGVTDPEETRLVESLLESYPDVAAEMDDYRSLVGALYFAAPPAQPPARLHDQLMAAASGKPTVSAAPAAAPKRALSFSRALLGFGLAAAALLILTNAFWVIRFNQLDAERRQMLDLVRGQGAVLAAVSSGSSHRVELASTRNSSVSLATVLWSPQSDVALLYSQDLPALEPGRTYQLWFIKGQTPISGGLFQLDSQGEAIYLFHPTEPMDQVDALGISDEPASGSSAPSTTPIAVGAVQT